MKCYMTIEINFGEVDIPSDLRNEFVNMISSEFEKENEFPCKVKKVQFLTNPLQEFIANQRLGVF